MYIVFWDQAVTKNKSTDVLCREKCGPMDISVPCMTGTWNPQFISKIKFVSYVDPTEVYKPVSPETESSFYAQYLNSRTGMIDLRWSN